MSLKKEVIRGVKWTSITTFVIIVCNILKLSFLTRLIEKADFGIIAIVNVFLGFVNIFIDFGISSAIFHREAITKDEYSSLYWTNLIFSVILFIVVILMAPIVGAFYKDDIYTQIVPLMGLNVLFFAIGRQFKVVEEKKLKFKWIGIVEAFSAITGLSVSIVLALNNYGVYSLVYSILVQYGMSNFVYLIYGISQRRIRFHYNFLETRPFLSIGIYQVGSQTINYFNRDFDVLIFGKMFGAEITGVYSLAKQLAMRPSQFINPIITKVATPALAKVQKDLEKLKYYYLKLVNVVASINLPIYIVMFLFAEAIVKIMYGVGYANGVYFVKALSVIMLIRAFGNPIGSLVVATGKTKIEFRWNLFVTLLVPTMLLLSSNFGIHIAVFCLLVTRLMLFVPSWRFLVYKLTGIKLVELLQTIFNIKDYLNNIRELRKN